MSSTLAETGGAVRPVVSVVLGTYNRLPYLEQAIESIRQNRAGTPYEIIVVNGCSDLMVEAFGPAGRHARSAVGVYRLPRNFAVEVDAVVEVAA